MGTGFKVDSDGTGTFIVSLGGTEDKFKKLTMDEVVKCMHHWFIRPEHDKRTCPICKALGHDT